MSKQDEEYVYFELMVAFFPNLIEKNMRVYKNV